MRKQGSWETRQFFLNMGNSCMFGVGSGLFGKIKQDVKKGFEMYRKCGRIDDDELGWIRELSNERFVCGKELDLSGSFDKGLFLLIDNLCFQRKVFVLFMW